MLARTRLLAWFDRHQRPMPWRKSRDPYRVWLSEIMLQQTRVAAVLDHYNRFLRSFPDVCALATASVEAVLAHWSGLGYYRRARAVHAAARNIAFDRGGCFPTTASEWQELPGVGRYTAAAIASIAFGEPCAAVDGNVKRVLARLLGSPPRDPWTVASFLLSTRRPGDFNQAMMELGATICTPHAPACKSCPIRACCVSGRTSNFAVGERRKTRQRKKEVAYVLARRRGRIWLVQRPLDASLMPGMWELSQLTRPGKGEPLLRVRHSITKTDYVVSVFAGDSAPNKNGSWFASARLAQLPLTGVTRKILRRLKVI